MSDQQESTNRHSGAEDAPPAPPDSSTSTAVARQRAGRRKGGKAAKQHVILTGLGVPTPAVDMSSGAGRLALIAAVVVAVAEGRCSGLTATTLLGAVREARAESMEAMEELLQRQAAEIDRLRAGGVVDVRRRA